jgi:hypothetical protein
MKDLERRYSMWHMVMKLRITIPGVYCLVNCDADGFEIITMSGYMEIGFTFAAACNPPTIVVPYTGWGSTAAGVAGTIVSASLAAVSAGVGNNVVAAIGVAASCAGVLAATAAIWQSALRGALNSLVIQLTDGSAGVAAESEFINSGQYANTSVLQAKKDYLLTKYKLYEDEQPFLLRVWKVDESKYSTPECGFTFAMSSDEKETVNILSSIRSFFISTDASERIMPSSVNGQEQTAQVSSFFGSEKIQAAGGIRRGLA